MMTPKNRERPAILIVDDTPGELKALISFLEGAGFQIAIAQSGETALKRIAYARPDLILLDVLMPGMDGFETCRRVKDHEAAKNIPVIFLTALSETVDKVKGFELGGVDFLTKPVQHEEVLARINAHLTIRRLHLRLHVQNAQLQEQNAQLQAEISIRKQTEEALSASKQAQNHLRKENMSLRSTIPDRYKFGEIIGKSPVMQAVYARIASAAAADANVLIYGESGTGKELVARTIHHLSERKDQTFVPVNCGAVPESLFEREFFGHRKGTFTGATMDKAGYFDHAHKGTLFLDEVAQLSQAMQVKLLRVLQDGEYMPLGDTQSKTADVRIIAATNQDLKTLLRQGVIREDFFYRIRVIVIDLPLLRERKEDIPLLIEHFLKQYGNDPECSTFPGYIMERLCAYDWPGNVRELQNELQRYLAVRHLDFVSTDPIEQQKEIILDFDPSNMVFWEAIQEFEKYVITRALTRNGWQRGKTAKMLNIPERTLYNKMQKYGLKRDPESENSAES